MEAFKDCGAKLWSISSDFASNNSLDSKKKRTLRRKILIENLIRFYLKFNFIFTHIGILLGEMLHRQSPLFSK